MAQAAPVMGAATVPEKIAGQVPVTAEAEDKVKSRKEQKHDPLYAGRVRVHPKAVDGKWRRIKTAALVVLLGIYYVMPWIRWDRGPGVPDQAVLADFVGQRFYFFWIEIWAHEVYYITGLLVMAAFGLFLATSLFGRVWCGFACPQTVWTDLFMWVERRIEGDRNARIRLDKQPWTADKAIKKISKHSIWLLIAFLTGGVWIMYFVDAPTLAREFFTGQAGGVVYFFVAFFTATTYLLAGMAREQVCTYMCPWPRIQGAMLDEDSLVVTYQRYRGEPRGKHKKGESFAGRGDCIDCKQCVAVCPMGIDIRDGLQVECIGCALCVDACDDIMRKVDRPLGLISFDTERDQHAKAKGRKATWKLVRPRTMIYTAVIVVLSGLMLGSLLFKSDERLTVLKDRSPMFVRMSDGSVRNGYTVKLLNMENQPRTFALTLEGLPAADLFTRGQEPGDELRLNVEPNGMNEFKVFVTVPADAVPDGQAGIDFVVEEAGGSGVTDRQDSVFRSP